MVGNNRKFAKITVVVEPLKGIGEADATAVIEDGADLVMHNEIDISRPCLQLDQRVPQRRVTLISQHPAAEMMLVYRSGSVKHKLIP